MASVLQAKRQSAYGLKEEISRRRRLEQEEREKEGITRGGGGRVGRETHPERNRCAREETEGERDEPLRLLPVVRLDAT